MRVIVRIPPLRDVRFPIEKLELGNPDLMVVRPGRARFVNVELVEWITNLGTPFQGERAASHIYAVCV